MSCIQIKEQIGYINKNKSIKKDNKLYQLLALFINNSLQKMTTSTGSVNLPAFENDLETISKIKENIEDLDLIINLIDQTLEPLTREQKHLKEIYTDINSSIQFIKKEELRDAENIMKIGWDTTKIDEELKRCRQDKFKTSKLINQKTLQKLNLKKNDQLNSLFIWILNIVYGVQEHGYIWKGFKQRILTTQHFNTFMGQFIISSEINYKVTKNEISKRSIYLQSLTNQAIMEQIELILHIAEQSALEYELGLAKTKSKQNYIKKQMFHQIKWQRLKYKQQEKQNTKKEILQYIANLQPIRRGVLLKKREVQLKRNQFYGILFSYQSAQRTEDSKQPSRQKRIHQNIETYNPRARPNEMRSYNSVDLERTRPKGSDRSTERGLSSLRSSQMLTPSKPPTPSGKNKSKFDFETTHHKKPNNETKQSKTAVKYYGHSNYQQHLGNHSTNLDPKKQILRDYFEKNNQSVKLKPSTREIVPISRLETGIDEYQQGCQRCILF